MQRGSSFVARQLARTLVFGVSLVLTGCGGESPPPKVETAPTKPSNPDKKPGKVGAKGKSALVEGGDMSAQERRAAKLKEKQAAGQ
jgi:hypothetical protein